MSKAMRRSLKVPTSVLKAITSFEDDGSQWAWPHGSVISAYRRLVRKGLAEETTGICEGCKTHRSGTEVPVFRILPGVDLY
jgi:hypothetical protein